MATGNGAGRAWPHLRLGILAAVALTALTAGVWSAARGSGGTPLETGVGQGASATLRPCVSKNLTLGRAGVRRWATGSLQVFAFTNTGDATCTLRGFPAIGEKGPSGQSQALPGVRDVSGPLFYSVPRTLVTLAPGASAGFYLGVITPGSAFAQDGAASCHGALVEAIPPGSTTPLVDAAQALGPLVPCRGTHLAPIYVSPVFPGTLLPEGREGT